MEVTNTLFLDTETRNEKPLKPGVHKYAETVEVMMAQWSWNDDEEVKVVEFPDGQMLQELVDAADVVVMHNSAFDRTVVRHALGVDIPVHKIHDTMVQALAHGLPAGLAQLCAALGITGDAAKDERGKKLIQLFCKPRPKNQKLRWATKATHPTDWQWLREYGGSDITAMRNAYRKMPRWNYPDNKREYALWCLDQKINDRGITVDADMARAAVDAAAAVRKYLNEQVAEDTDGAITNLRQRDPFLSHVMEQFGIDLPDLRKATLERRLEDPSLPEEVKELLRARLFASAASVAKYKSLLASVCLDGRLRGTLQFCGAARTGRWAGRLFQPQNIPRTSKKWKKIVKRFIRELVAGAVDLIYDPKDVMDGLVNALRGVLVASKGHKLVASDLSNIEGRMLAWLAGEDWKLKAFARGDDLYILGYAASFGVPVDEVIADEAAGGVMRLIGKVQELALGYQGAVGAFSSMAAVYGLELPEERILEIVKGWRKANKKIVSFWYDLEAAAKKAIELRGRSVVACRRLKLTYKNGWLNILLPSGRILSYPSAKIIDGKITYMGVNQYTRKWERLHTYGGKLVENVTQAAARDVIAHNMQAAEDAGFNLLMTVHDEIVSEVPVESGLTSKHLSAILATNPPWAEGLPLAAEGFEDDRYRK